MLELKTKRKEKLERNLITYILIILPRVGVILEGVLDWRLDLLTTLTHDS
jgi:hypothetical protein